ncbi:MAG: extracellular solute-binding protein [Lachnospiraceae bacterium]
MEQYKKIISVLCVGGILAAAMTGCGNSTKTAKNASEHPIFLTVWTYYNGDQLETFNSLVEKFNTTTGKEKGIQIESQSQGSVSDLEQNVMDAAQKKVGASEMPNIFSAYADTAYTLDQMGMVVDLGTYMTDEEKEKYISSYLEEGDFSGDGSIKIFPVAKCTEELFLNKTDWETFAGDCGVSDEDLQTVESLLAVAEKYYDWSGGKAFFGRDAMANYMLIGAKQLGCTLFEVKDGKMTLDFDKEVVRRLWDSYYVPFVKGWFAASGRFRSDDIKTGNILAYTGSTSSATFFPTQVMADDNISYDIEMKVLPSPVFEGGEAYAVQQGAGMVVTRGTEEEEAASMEFLKWFTELENNIAFSVGAGYLPVTVEANDMAEIKKNTKLTSSMEEILSEGVETVTNNTLYTSPAFKGGADARSILEYAMSDQAAKDREAVLGKLEKGISEEEAEAEFLSDAHFESWYESTLKKLQALEG